ncbi:EAL domain-containing protein [Bradyrhizobium sp. 186]|uniref:EAL domain-containing protein n=1 Tax=Bradyrhizobium sp. 186 TaxID=2782654 RepID=UPI00200076E2|nr:EAL domain-containing protein [Bradyrhizobium sp. 186]UPK38910.1 EAL domain-containing protein [Bradyrhizobium sp. 186]
MEKETAVKPARFGQRKIVPRACVADPKKHVRAFLCETLEELGFITCECAHSREVAAVIDLEVPDLFLLGFVGDGVETAKVLQSLADERFQGQVLLVGPRNSLALSALGQLGLRLGLTMRPLLAMPYGEKELRASLANFMPIRVPPPPAVDAAEALHKGWLELWYQPKINVRTLSVCGTEGLVRIRHPYWGIVSPSYFIPDHRDPHFVALSEFIINQAVADWHSFISESGSIEIAINLPLSFLTSPDALKTIRRLLPKHPAFSGIIVEITAAEVLRDLKLAKDIAEQLKWHNIGVSVDELGTEWPLLLNQDKLPFLELKVDREFIRGCADHLVKQTVCRRRLEVSHSLGTRTVAEGAETRGDFLTARELGFNVVQGYYFGKPMERKMFARHIFRRSGSTVAD